MSSISQSDGPSKLGDSKQSPPLAKGLDSAAVLQIARQAVSTNDVWVASAEFEKPKQRDDGSWTVMVWRLPRTLGGHRLITISTDGKIISYSRGK